MKEKDFMALDVQEQKEHLNELIQKWQEQDSNNRCAIVILGNKTEDKEDSGESSFCFVGPGRLLMESLGTSMHNSKGFGKMAELICLGPLAKLVDAINLDNNK